MSYASIAAGIATRVKTITALAQRCDTYPNPNPQTPWAVVVPKETSLDDDHGDGTTSNWTVRVLVARADDRAAAASLYDYMPGGSKDVAAALEADPTLGGSVDTITGLSHDEPAVYQYGSGQLLGVNFNFTAHT